MTDFYFELKVTYFFQTKTWSSIFQSWDLFCHTPASDILTVPKGLNFDITDFLGKICQMDFVEMGHELAEFEAVDELNVLVRKVKKMIGDTTYSS